MQHSDLLMDYLGSTLETLSKFYYKLLKILLMQLTSI